MEPARDAGVGADHERLEHGLVAIALAQRQLGEPGGDGLQLENQLLIGEGPAA
jgi:hypothetical protein